MKLDFLKIEFQFKTRFLDNRVIVNLKFKKKKKSGARGPCEVLKFVPRKKFKWNSSTLHGTRVLEKIKINKKILSPRSLSIYTFET